MDCQKKSINVRYKTPTHTKILLPADRVYENNKKKEKENLNRMIQILSQKNTIYIYLTIFLLYIFGRSLISFLKDSIMYITTHIYIYVRM